jgi:hypothetical protein
VRTKKINRKRFLLALCSYFLLLLKVFFLSGMWSEYICSNSSAPALMEGKKHKEIEVKY